MFMQVKVLFLLLLLLLVFALVTMTSSSPNANNMMHNIQIIRREQGWKATVAPIDSSTDLIGIYDGQEEEEEEEVVRVISASRKLQRLGIGRKAEILVAMPHNN